MYSSLIKVFRQFDNEYLSSNVDQLLTLLSSKPNEQLHATTTLLIGNWNWLDKKSVFIPFRETTAIAYIFMNARIAIGHYLVEPIIKPWETTLRAFAKLRLYLPISQFNLPNVSYVVYVVYFILRKLLTYLRCNLGSSLPQWIISRIVKLLQKLPRLCELSLIMERFSKQSDHLLDCIAKLRNLRKLSIKFILSRYLGTNSSCSKFNSIVKIIAKNPIITHLEVVYDSVIYDHKIEYLAQTPRHVPADRPMKLEHLRIPPSFYNSAALAPHISSLTSIDIDNSDILNELLKQNIFPPTMTFRSMDQYTNKYLDRHPRIVSLTVYYCGYSSTCSTLLGILSRHSQTLTHLGFCPWVLFRCIGQTQNELAFLRCTNLKQLLLDYRSPSALWIPVLEQETVS